MTNTNIRVSEKWRAIIERDACHTTLSEIAEGIENALPEFEAHTIRLTEWDISKIVELARKKHISFDDVVNDLIQKAFDLRLHYRFKAIRDELMDNLPVSLEGAQVKDGEKAYQSRSVLFNRELLHKTCLVARKRTNGSEGEMITKMTRYGKDGKRQYFSFAVGSTVRLVLSNYQFFENKQALIKASEMKHANQ